MYNKLKKPNKIKYFTDLFERYKRDIRKTWQIINYLARDTSNKCTLPDTFRMDYQELTNSKTKAYEFCNYFKELCSNSISKSRKEYDKYLSGTLNGNSIYLPLTD